MGGGPTGIEISSILAGLRHNVTLVEKVLLNQEFNYLEQTYYEMGEGYTNNLDTLPDIYFWEEHIYRTPTNNVDLKLTFYKVKKYFKQLGQIWIQ